MWRLPTPRGALLLYAAFTTVHALPPRNIFTRQNVCSAGGLNSCGSNVPENFCCGDNTRCVVLAAGTTVLCCPSDQTCAKIAPIVCNITQQDASQNIGAEVKTTALDVDLPTCGDECCPFGYSCNEKGECIMDDDQSIAPGGARTTGSATTTSTASTSTGTDTSSSEASPVNGAGPENKQTEEAAPKSFPTVAVVVGVLCGVLALVGVVAGVMVYKSRKNKKEAGEKRLRSSSTTSSFGNMISEPIVDDANGSAIRHDFILKPSSTRSSSQPASPSRPDRFSNGYGRDSGLSQQVQQFPAGPLGSPRSATEASSSRRPPRPNSGASIPPIRGMNDQHDQGGYYTGMTGRAPETPRLQREPSSESINVFAAPGTVERIPDQGRRMTTATTFTDLMEEADLGGVHKGQSFLATPPPAVPRR